jgi:hypothetical protein
MSGTQQVGITGSTNSLSAALWTGTKESWVNLSPAGSTESLLNATNGTYQVGGARFGINDPFHAGVWNGTAGSYEDLSTYLPAGSFDSYATGVWNDGPNIRISGYFYDASLGVYRPCSGASPSPNRPHCRCWRWSLPACSRDAASVHSEPAGRERSTVVSLGT